MKEQKIKIEEEYDDEYTDFSPSSRWVWVRHFICFVIITTLAVHLFNPYCMKKENCTITNNGKTHTILQTGFPPLENLQGSIIEPEHAVAVAFSPKSSSATSEESWWDRLFPNRHVHLESVQLPVVILNSDRVETTLSVCTTKKRVFGNHIGSPDLTHCIETTNIALDKDEIEEGSSFGIIEWVPESAIVLKKSTKYWIVVQAPTEGFKWVSAEDGLSPFGTVQEVEDGWQLKTDSVPSIMITVEDH